MECWLGLVLITLLFAIILLITNSKKPKGFPPGPAKLPFLGSLPLLPPDVTHGRKRLSDYLAEKWGDVVGMYIGNRPKVFISDVEKLRKLFRMDEASGRPNDKPYNSNRFGDENKSGHSRGLLFSSGEEWRDQRRFALRTLRDLGFGKMTMEDTINEEVEKLVEVLMKKAGQAIELNLQMNISIVNALWVILVGEKLALDDPKLLKVVKTIDDLLRFDQTPNFYLMQISPWAVKHFSSHFKSFKRFFDQVKEMIWPYVREHQSNNSSEDSKDFIDVYLKEIEKTTDQESSFYGKYGEHSLISSLLDLFTAGTETTSSTLLWGILFMLHHPEVQDRVHSEIDHVMGDRLLANWSDRDNLPYTCAVINEIHRTSSIVQQGIPHVTTTEIDLDGHMIPKGTTVVGNLRRIHHDPRYWKNPDVFDPDRFYDQENNKCLNSNNLIPFMVGKRFCLGQTLAEKELFLFFVGLMKAFEFNRSPDDSLPDCNYDAGPKRSIIRCAPFYKVILKHRK